MSCTVRAAWRSSIPGRRARCRRCGRRSSGAGIAVADLRAILLTHIHLDHAGATGTLVRENPTLRVYVHEKGAPHMADPEKLVASATRLWGDEMDRLWGEFRPVPADAIIVLKGGERIAAGGRDLEVAYTPGHASHHVSFFSADTGIAFVGDTAGIRLRPGAFVMPPTPPPDINLEPWRDSLAPIAGGGRTPLFITHFGPHAPVGAHLTEMAVHLELPRTSSRRRSRGPAATTIARVVRRGTARRIAAPAERRRRRGVRSRRPVQFELARAGQVLEEEE